MIPTPIPTRRVVIVVGWLAIAVPALYQLTLVAIAIWGRIGYPFDLEWMEGGLLDHSKRLSEAHGLYGPPSIEFIPYLYTPLYPALLALLGKLFGLGYFLGRLLSVLSLIGIVIVAAVSIRGPRYHHVSPGPTWAGIALGIGFFAAAYPYVEGWYDLVRADTMFAFLVTAGIAAASMWARDGKGWRGEARIALVAVIFVLAFFTKQTGIFYVVLGGAVIFVLAWRRTVTYIAVAAILGVGGTALGNVATDGWFWIYVSKIHRAHDFNMDRFWKSYGNILWHFPAMSIVVLLTLIAVMYTWLRRPPHGGRRELPRQAQPFLVWTAAFAVSTVVGAIGWGTEFAHFNAYIPALLHGALAAGAAIPALAACAGIVWGARPYPRLVTHGVAAVAALALGATLAFTRWDPNRFIPQESDAIAGHKLIDRIRHLEGEVWIPSHPWYLALAGKTPYVHRMGIKDVTTRGQNRVVAGLEESLREHRFAEIVLDDRDLADFSGTLPLLLQEYRPALELPPDERPQMYTGAPTLPKSIWVPNLPPTAPAGASTLFDFETATWTGWIRSGPAWGDGPVTESQPGQELVFGATGHRFATSSHGGDIATGRITSSPFTIDGIAITLHLGGSQDATKLRAELWVEGAQVRTAGSPPPGGDTLREIKWDVADLRGKLALLVLVDDSPVGHLDCDDVWMWKDPKDSTP